MHRAPHNYAKEKLRRATYKTLELCEVTLSTVSFVTCKMSSLNYAVENIYNNFGKPQSIFKKFSLGDII